MTDKWQEVILRNFEYAAKNYNSGAEIQRIFAWKLAKKCSEHSIANGLWADLGAGTGLLAEALELLNPSQSVIRVDRSKSMLEQHNPSSLTNLWDLNFGLPSWSELPTLLASNFALHWLNEPQTRVTEWFNALAPGGWLALVLPVNGSFPEWYEASNQAKVPCTANIFPTSKSLLKPLPLKKIQYARQHLFTQKSTKVTSLLKPMVKVGAQACQHRSLSVGDWKRLQKHWPRSLGTKEVTLTWKIQILLAQK